MNGGKDLLDGSTAMRLRRYLNRVCRVPAERLAEASASDLVAIAGQYQVSLEQFQVSSQPTEAVAGATSTPGVREQHPDSMVGGDAYSGEFNASGQREGRGLLQLANGSTYEGEFKADLYDGRGVYTSARGDVYDGQYKAGVMEGHGSFLFANGDYYEGSYSAGLMEGRGSYREGSSGDVHEGEFKAGNKVGRGVKTFGSGETMVAWFSADEPVGEGVVWSADRAEIWRMQDGVPVDAISEAEAARIMEGVDARSMGGASGSISSGS